MINKVALEYGASSSAIRELFEFGKKRKLEVGEENVYDFSIGNPSVPTPKEYNDELVNLLVNEDRVKIHSYTSSFGDNEARIAIAEDLNNRYTADIDYKLIYLTCGAAAGLSIAINALTNKGDNVVVFAPFFPEYSVFITHAGCEVNIVNPDKEMKIDYSSLEEEINEKTSLVIINSPNNPTGVIYSEEDVVKLTTFLKRKEEEYHHPIYLISDEPYRELIYEDIKYPFITNYYDNSLITYSFSKSLSLPGERIGYIIVNKNIDNPVDVFNAIKGAGRLLGFVCAPSLFQHAIKESLKYKTDLNQYKKNRDLIYEQLTSLGYEVIHPDGAFYLFVKALEDDANKFSTKAKEFNLLLVPSDSFGFKGYVRISYCVKEKTIKDSYQAFKKLKESY